VPLVPCPKHAPVTDEDKEDSHEGKREEAAQPLRIARPLQATGKPLFKPTAPENISSETGSGTPRFAPARAFPGAGGDWLQCRPRRALGGVAQIVGLPAETPSLLTVPLSVTIHLVSSPSGEGKGGQMPRSKRSVRRVLHHCKVCPNTFYAVRGDASYCSPKCRKAINRAMQLVAQVTGKPLGLKADSRVECRECGTRMDGRTTRCPVCRSTAKQKVK